MEDVERLVCLLAIVKVTSQRYGFLLLAEDFVNIGRNTYRPSSRTTSHTQHIKHLARLWSWLFGIQLDRRNMIDSALSHTQKQICFSSALPSTAPTPWRMLWTRYDQSTNPFSAAANSFQWYPEVLHFCPYTPLILVGLKSDLRTKRTCIDLLKTQGLTPVTEQQGRSVAQKMNARYMECSSKEMIGVDEIFRDAINIVVANDPKNQPTESTSGQGGGGQGQAADGMVRKKKKRSCRIL